MNTFSVERPLAGIRVLEVAQLVSGPYCGTLLAELGASVVKVEPPHGDMARNFGPFVDGESAYFRAVNRGKETVNLDLNDQSDREVMEKLLADADIFITNMSPAAANRNSLSQEQLTARHPRLIVCSISGYGSEGMNAERVGVDLIFQAESGLMSITGYPGGPPTRVGTNVPDFFGALSAFSGIMVALRSRDVNNVIEHVEVSLMEATLAMQTCWLAAHSAGSGLDRMGNGSPFSSPTGSFETADGFLVVSIVNNHQWARFCEILGQPDWREDQRFATNDLRCINRDTLESLMKPVLGKRPAQDWRDDLNRGGVGAAVPTDYEDVLSDWNDWFHWVDGVAIAGLPFRVQNISKKG